MKRRYYRELTEAQLENFKNEIHRKCMQRIPRYLRLGFVIRELSKELIFDDQLWEAAKDLPIDPDNSVDRINRAGKAVKEGKLSKEKVREMMDRQKAILLKGGHRDGNEQESRIDRLEFGYGTQPHRRSVNAGYKSATRGL